MPVRRRHHVLGAVNVGTQALQGPVPDDERPDGGGQVEDPVGAALSSSTSPLSRIEPSTNRKPGPPETAARFSRRPVLRLSRPTTSWPAASRASTRCEPMNPAAPVTKTFIGDLLPARQLPPGADRRRSRSRPQRRSQSPPQPCRRSPPQPRPRSPPQPRSRSPPQPRSRLHRRRGPVPVRRRGPVVLRRRGPVALRCHGAVRVPAHGRRARGRPPAAAPEPVAGSSASCS